MRIHPIFHISLLKPTLSEKTTEDVETSEFEVDKIVERKNQKRKAAVQDKMVKIREQG